MLGSSIIHHQLIKEFLLNQINAWSQVGGGAFMDAYELRPNELPPKKMVRHPDRWHAGLQIKQILKFAADHKIPMGIYEDLIK